MFYRSVGACSAKVETHLLSLLHTHLGSRVSQLTKNRTSHIARILRSYSRDANASQRIALRVDVDGPNAVSQSSPHAGQMPEVFLSI